MKILVFSHNCFSKTLNNGKTLSSLFSHFKHNEICQLYLSDNDVPNHDICNIYYKVTDYEMLKRILPFKRNKKPQNRLEKNAKSLPKKIKSKTISKFIRDIVWLSNKWDTNKLHNWLKTNNIKGIFFVGGDAIFSHLIALKLSKRYKIPLFSYFTDDYILYPKPSNLIQYLYLLQLKKIYKKTINHSKKLFVIGDQMAKEYEEFFNKPFIPIMNAVDIKPASSIKARIPITINYFGGLHLNRWKTIIELANIIQNNNPNKIIEINIYTFCKDKTIIEELKTKGIKVHEGLKGNQYDEALLNSSFLLHVESFDKKYRELTKLSVSTKIPEYLISNRPILALGPQEVASIKLLTDNNIGFYLDKTRKESIDDFFNLVNNIEQQTILAERAYNYAKQHFDKKKQAEKLYNELMK